MQKKESYSINLQLHLKKKYVYMHYKLNTYVLYFCKIFARIVSKCNYNKSKFICAKKRPFYYYVLFRFVTFRIVCEEYREIYV